MAWTRARRRWALTLVLVLAALAVPLVAVARRHEPTPSGTPINVLLQDFKVQRDAAVVPAGTVSFHIRNQGPTTHEFIVVRTDRAPDKLPLQRDGLTVNEDAPSIHPVEEVEGLDIDDRETLNLDLAAGQYVMFCNLEGHYLGGCMRRSPSAEGGAVSACTPHSSNGASLIAVMSAPYLFTNFARPWGTRTASARNASANAFLNPTRG